MHQNDPILAKYSAPQAIFFKKAFLGQNFDQKLGFFGARSPLKISIYCWPPSDFKKHFSVHQPKMDISKLYKGGSFWVHDFSKTRLIIERLDVKVR